MAFNLPKKLIKADIQVKAKTNSLEKNKEEAEGFFHIAFFFEVDNIDELIRSNDIDLLDIHSNLANAIDSISYSTARGILLTRFQGTALHDFILPVINPNDLLEHG